MTPPTFIKGIGRLALDRYDFENHFKGSDFRHDATQVDLSPALDISGDGYLHVTTVQEAIEALNVAITPPVIQNATTFVSGIVRLTGDIGGVSTNVVVTGIQQRPVNNLAPNNLDVLTWDSLNSNWTPRASTIFTAGGDLSGTSSNQTVKGLTGDGSGHVTAACNSILFTDGFNPTIKQSSGTNTFGHYLFIEAQDGVGANQNGGYVIISGGGKTGSGLGGGVTLQIDDHDSNMLQLTEVISGQHVLTLVKPTVLTTAEMPANTGDMVIFIADATTIPNGGTPSGGTILYSQSGTLNVKQSDAQQFAIGSLSNPTIWGSTGQQTYTQRNFSNTTNVTPATAFSFTLTDLTAAKVDVFMVGKKEGTADSAQFDLSMGYVRNGGAPQAVGSVSTTTRNTAGASGWTAPTITVSGNVIQVLTGFNSSTNIHWTTVTRLTLCTDT